VSTARRGLPQGRAGRVWLRRRLEVAERASGVLERKRRLLRREQRRLSLLLRRTGGEWDDACAGADRWWLRAALTSGEGPLVVTAGRTEGSAAVNLGWQSTTGVAYPGEVDVVFPGQVPETTNAALVSAAGAYRRALEAGVRHAAVSCAVGRVDAELEATAQRLRSIDRRWIPGLRRDLADVEQRLDELEREAAVCLRWARGAATEGRHG
jgi:V/A-type H+-transporting ATPase subunit D